MLTSKKRALLRGRANSLEAIVHIGKAGITENLAVQAKDALAARELVKCRVLENSLLSAGQAANSLAGAVGAEVVTVVGNVFVLYKHSPKLHQSPPAKKKANPVRAGVQARARKAREEKQKRKEFHKSRATAQYKEKSNDKS